MITITKPYRLVRIVKDRHARKTGGTTWSISLPHEWVSELGIKPHDHLFAAVLEDGSLKLSVRENNGN
jgi:phosphate uptake regulator